MITFSLLLSMAGDLMEEKRMESAMERGISKNREDEKK
jgi:hypothetical protein